MTIQSIVPVNANEPIVENNKTMTQRYRTWLLQVNATLPILGEGSPEGNVDAPLYSLYIDTTSTTSGAIDYRKMLSDIAGDTKQGWIAI